MSNIVRCSLLFKVVAGIDKLRNLEKPFFFAVFLQFFLYTVGLHVGTCTKRISLYCVYSVNKDFYFNKGFDFIV